MDVLISGPEEFWDMVDKFLEKRGIYASRSEFVRAATKEKINNECKDGGC